MEKKGSSISLTNAPDPIPQSLIEKSRKKKLDKGVRFLIIHLLVIVSLPFFISDLPPENLIQEDPFHSKGEKAPRFSWNMNPQGG
jgi:hypothetical protein